MKLFLIVNIKKTNSYAMNLYRILELMIKDIQMFHLDKANMICK
jgi:hypothetical protein